MGKPEDDPYVPTSEDLAGFWDMVYIQVVNVHAMFAELHSIRKNGWKRPQVEKSISVPKKEPSKTKVKTNKANGKAGTGAKSEAAKARDEARRKMLEERKRQMKLKQQQQCEQKKENEKKKTLLEKKKKKKKKK